MARRVSLPTADDLFRPTSDEEATGRRSTPNRVVTAVPDQVDTGAGATEEADRPTERAEEAAGATRPSGSTTGRAGTRRSSGRVRHDEKMTVYVTAEELLDLEHARLALRRDHGIAVDRGRLVREAIAIVLADLDERGADSDLVHRLEQ